MTTLVVAARRHLVAQPNITSLVGSSATYANWIWQWKPYVSMEGTGKAGIVLAQRNGWATPNLHNTMAFPQLQVEIYADVDRRADLNPADAVSAELRAEAVFLAVDKHLHLVGRDGAPWQWGATAESTGVRVLSSHRLGEPEYAEVPDGDGLVRCLARYGVTLG